MIPMCLPCSASDANKEQCFRQHKCHLLRQANTLKCDREWMNGQITENKSYLTPAYAGGTGSNVHTGPLDTVQQSWYCKCRTKYHLRNADEMLSKIQRH